MVFFLPCLFFLLYPVSFSNISSLKKQHGHQEFQQLERKESSLLLNNSDHPILYLYILRVHLQSTGKISHGRDWKIPSLVHGPLIYPVFFDALCWLGLFIMCSISVHPWVLQEYIVDSRDLRKVMKGCVIQHRGDSKLRDTEEAEISVATLNLPQFDFAPLEA